MCRTAVPCSQLDRGSTSRSSGCKRSDWVTMSAAIGGRLSAIERGVSRARAMTDDAGLRSMPMQLTPRAAATAVVVPEPFHGSKTD